MNCCYKVFHVDKLSYKSVIQNPQNTDNNVKEYDMERLVLNKLLKWKNSPYRKPLILKDVRQVGNQ